MRALAFAILLLASSALAADELIADALGPAISREFLTVRQAGLAAYDLHAHPWERQMYLEVI